MKIKHTENKLIILDEATNSLDSRAERRIFDQFLEISREKGQTLVIVTHRLAHLAHHADQILCVFFFLLYLLFR
jgi:energy-coupling factor transporter ATP-binding protein EcfA2